MTHHKRSKEIVDSYRVLVIDELSFLNLFMNTLIRERVVLTISANTSWDILGTFFEVDLAYHTGLAAVESALDFSRMS
jgi:hypothetical protein